MNQLPAEWVACFDRRLDHAHVPPTLRPAYHKWVKLYLYFCNKFNYPPTAPNALGPFLTKLAEKNYSIDDRHHAAVAVRLLLKYDPQDRDLYLQLSAPAPFPLPRSEFDVPKFKVRCSAPNQPPAASILHHPSSGPARAQAARRPTRGAENPRPADRPKPRHY